MSAGNQDQDLSSEDQSQVSQDLPDEDAFGTPWSPFREEREEDAPTQDQLRDLVEKRLQRIHGFADINLDHFDQEDLRFGSRRWHRAKWHLARDHFIDGRTVQAHLEEEEREWLTEDRRRRSIWCHERQFLLEEWEEVTSTSARRKERQDN
jgi:hypothetical protein